ncbi:MAG: hypothetical protein A2X12_04830 [Bacteroidetes bacterium GWE2_29_8]|nr:MAG: hypothetical protein A2X12_04830 [Bacteroidetes bacterium GWE2_29_8]OFY24601.1 MAG: hypothetical protein A2X02_03305 [Bacteroidetes bacterium GWF2_29_10]
MEIKTEKRDSVVILSVSGRIDVNISTQLEKEVVSNIESNNINIIVDCTNLDYISSSGLRVLLLGLKKTTALKGNFILCNLNKNIAEIFDISGFTSIFKICENVEQAINSLG